MLCVLRSGVLQVEDVPLTAVAAAVGTPVHVVSAAKVRAAAPPAVPGVHRIVRVRSIPGTAVLRLLASQGVDADVSSGAEMRRALAAGIAPSAIGFSGVARNGVALAAALDVGIGRFTLELEEEGRLLSALALARGTRASALLRVALPDSHSGIGLAAICAVYGRLSGLAGLELQGLAIHVDAFLDFDALRRLIARLRAGGHRVDRVDLKGPPGIFNEAALRARAHSWRLAFGVEAADILAGTGILLARVLQVERTPLHARVLVDAAVVLPGRVRAVQPRGQHVIARVVGLGSPDRSIEAGSEAVQRGDLVVLHPGQSGVPQLLVDGSRCEFDGDRLLGSARA
ncbi:hypothetical protein [Sphingomonas desiccabilis]|uniref:hypothetical protein n=1 Tax=Sphingomonas desiccabilis TaxID=429134 RepID=UPI0013EA282E|nr:hypothetical protein [Sphingomonas desiccabilis]